MTPELSRRSLLKVGGGAVLGLGLGAGRLPAWARAPARAAQGLGPGALPFPNLPEGTATMPQIEHIVVLMMENQSFDSILGMLPDAGAGRRRVDGLPVTRGPPDAGQPRPDGAASARSSPPTPCQEVGTPGQNWNAQPHLVRQRAQRRLRARERPVAMWLLGRRRRCPSTYSLARTFPLGERWFCSVLAQTYPNRRFLFAGTASGTIATNAATSRSPAAERHDLGPLRPLGITGTTTTPTSRAR